MWILKYLNVTYPVLLHALIYSGQKRLLASYLSNSELCVSLENGNQMRIEKKREKATRFLNLTQHNHILVPDFSFIRSGKSISPD